MQSPGAASWSRALRMVLLAVLLLPLLVDGAAAQQRRQRATPVPVPAPAPEQSPAPAAPQAAAPVIEQPRETIQADVSTRRIAITANFSGTEIVVFGAVDNSRQQTAEAGLYDVVVVIVGTATRLVARKKNNVAGLWLNTDSMLFQGVPSYYAIASTRPLDEISSDEVLKSTGIGFDYVPMQLGKGSEHRTAAEIKEFRDAVVRLKKKDRLFRHDEYSVAFIGRSLFRASIDVPATVTVGPFDTRVFLFRDGELLSQYTARLNLEREGLEEALHGFAFKFPIFYGVATVLLALASGLIASTVFRKGTH